MCFVDGIRRCCLPHRDAELYLILGHPELRSYCLPSLFNPWLKCPRRSAANNTSDNFAAWTSRVPTDAMQSMTYLLTSDVAKTSEHFVAYENLKNTVVPCCRLLHSKVTHFRPQNILFLHQTTDSRCLGCQKGFIKNQYVKAKIRVV